MPSKTENVDYMEVVEDKATTPRVMTWTTTSSCPVEEEAFLEERIVLDDDSNLEIIGTEEQRINLFADFARYCGLVQNPELNALNPFLKQNYANLASVLNATRGILADVGIGVMQTPYCSDGTVFLRTMMVHRDGGAIVFPAISAKPSKADIQQTVATITYLRRIAYQSVVNVVGEAESDGEDLKGKDKKKPATDSPMGKLIALCAEKAKFNRDAVVSEIAKFTSDGSNVVHNIPASKIDDATKAINAIK